MYKVKSKGMNILGKYGIPNSADLSKSSGEYEILNQRGGGGSTNSPNPL